MDDPTCGSNITGSEVNEGDVILLWCEVTYSGRWAPIMTWTRQTRDSGEMLNSTNVEQASSSVRQELTYTVPASADPVELHCHTTFAPLVDMNNGDDSDRYAVNSLVYSHEYSTQFTVNRKTSLFRQRLHLSDGKRLDSRN